MSLGDFPMPQIICSRCNSSFAVGEASTKGGVKCPKCGSVNPTTQAARVDDWESMDFASENSVGGLDLAGLDLSQVSQPVLPPIPKTHAYATPRLSPEPEEPASNNRAIYFAVVGSIAFTVLAIAVTAVTAWWMMSRPTRLGSGQVAIAPTEANRGGTEAGGNRTSSSQWPNGKPSSQVADPTNVPASGGPDTLDLLKAATVFVKVATTVGSQSGSGFILDSADGSAIIVTNAHVIKPERGQRKEIQCVLFSGTRDEKILSAEVVGKDEVNDLAVLRIKGSDLPQGISNEIDVPVRETMPVLVLGFPFGEGLATTGKSPSITVSKGAISSIRRDEYDQIAILQIDGGINPGNSGGPTVTEDGKLLGISVAKVSGTQIGFAIPRRDLHELLKGRVATAQVHATNRTENTVKYDLRVELLDPRQNIQAIDFVAFEPSKQVKGVPNNNQGWEVAANEIAVLQELTVNGNSALAAVSMPVHIADGLFQLRVKRKDGSEWVSPPRGLRENGGGNLAQSTKKLPNDGGGLHVAELPVPMADFAFNVSTGDIAGVDPKSNDAYLFTRDKLASGDFSDVQKVKVGSNPISIAYKQFKNSQYFIVVGTEDSNIYVLDAKEFKVVKKVPLESIGATFVSCSTNPDDPFIYYGFGRDHSRGTGAVDLRKMVDTGLVSSEAMECVLSFDGRLMYTRGPYNPTGFNCHVMTSGFDAPKPIFVHIYNEHRDAARFVADPFGELTANGQVVYSANLTQRKANLNFSALAFFKSKPIIVGVRDRNICVASYNTLSSIGTMIEMPKELLTKVDKKTQRDNGNDEAQKKLYSVRAFADEQNARVVFANYDHIGLIPLSAFECDDEPFMRLTLSSKDIKVGLKNEVVVSPGDPRIQIEYGDLPPGMEQTEKGLAWTPVDEDVGVTTIPVTLTFGEIQRSVELELKVTQPFVQSPVLVAGFAMDPELSKVVIWSGTPYDRRGYVDASKMASSEVVILPMRGGGETIRRPVPYPLKQAVLIDDNLATLSLTDNNKVDIYELPSMKRSKSLVATSPLVRLSVDKSQLLLHSQNSTEVYDTPSFKKIRTNATNENSIPGRGGYDGMGEFVDGKYVNGVLKDGANDKAKLIVAPQGMLILPGADQSLFAGSFLPRANANRNNGGFQSDGARQIVVQPTSVPKRNLQIAVEHSSTNIQGQGNVSNYRVKQTVSLLLLDSAGSRLARIPITEDQLTLEQHDRTYHLPNMEIIGDHVFISAGSRIYRWKIASPDNAPQEDSGGELRILPQQSAFIVENRTTLKHTVVGGTQPIEFTLITNLKGVQQDETTGNVTVDRDKLLDEVGPALRTDGRANEQFERLQVNYRQAIEFLRNNVGVKVGGIPVAVPIHFKAIDVNGVTSQIQYFVILDLTQRQFFAAMKQKK
jgi:S1-C subfamily serine protease/phage FluMu protein Com